jgi:hypothetical protein
MYKEIMFDLYNRRKKELDESCKGPINWMEHNFGVLYVLNPKDHKPHVVELSSDLDTLIELPATPENESLIVYIAALHEWAKVAEARMHIMQEIIVDGKAASTLKAKFLENLAKEI